MQFNQPYSAPQTPQTTFQNGFQFYPCLKSPPSLPQQTYPSNYMQPYRGLTKGLTYTGPFRDVVGEGDVATIVLPDGTAQMFFLPVAKCGHPILNQNGPWFVRSINTQCLPPPSPAPPHQCPICSHNNLLALPPPPCAPIQNSLSGNETNQGLKFHLNQSTSSEDIGYFFPGLQQTRGVPRQPTNEEQALQKSTRNVGTICGCDNDETGRDKKQESAECHCRKPPRTRSKRLKFTDSTTRNTSEGKGVSKCECDSDMPIDESGRGKKRENAECPCKKPPRTRSKRLRFTDSTTRNTSKDNAVSKCECDSDMSIDESGRGKKRENAECPCKKPPRKRCKGIRFTDSSTSNTSDDNGVSKCECNSDMSIDESRRSKRRKNSECNCRKRSRKQRKRLRYVDRSTSISSNENSSVVKCDCIGDIYIPESVRGKNLKSSECQHREPCKRLRFAESDTNNTSNDISVEKSECESGMSIDESDRGKKRKNSECPCRKQPSKRRKRLRYSSTSCTSNDRDCEKERKKQEEKAKKRNEKLEKEKQKTEKKLREREKKRKLEDNQKKERQEKCGCVCI